MNLSEKLTKVEAMRSELVADLENNGAEMDATIFAEKKTKAQGLRAEADNLRQAIDEINASSSSKSFENKDGQKLKNSFDFGRLLRNACGSIAQSGAEAEMIAEANSRFANSGITAQGFALPMEVFNAHSAGSADNGQNLIEVNKGSFVESLKKRLVLGQLGVQVLTDLNGTIEMGASTTPVEPTAKAETASADDATLTLVNRTLTPTRGGVKSVYSKQLQNQTSYNIQQILSDELLAGMASRAEAHAIAEILANAGTTVAIGTNGGALTREKAIELMNAIDVTDSNGINNAFIANPLVRQSAMNINVDSGSGKFLWNEETPGTFLGMQALVTNHVPKNLSKGTGTNLSAIAYGDFSYLTIGYWGGIDLVVDPFSLAESGQMKIVLNFFHDSVLRQPGNFAVIKDITTA